MTYEYEFQLTPSQLADGMTIGGKDVLRRSGSRLPTFLSLLTAILVTAGTMAIVWVAHMLITDDLVLPPVLIILGSILGMSFGIGSQKLHVNAMVTGALKTARMRGPSHFSVAPCGISTDGNGARFDIKWPAIDTITPTKTCVHFIAGGIVFVLPIELITDLSAFLTQVHAWHEEAQV